MAPELPNEKSGVAAGAKKLEGMDWRILGDQDE
jgi:hypothetical protein